MSARCQVIEKAARAFLDDMDDWDECEGIVSLNVPRADLDALEAALRLPADESDESLALARQARDLANRRLGIVVASRTVCTACHGPNLHSMDETYALVDRIDMVRRHAAAWKSLARKLISSKAAS